MFSTKDELNEFLQTLTELWLPEQLPEEMVLPGYVIDNVLEMGPGLQGLQYYGARGGYHFDIIRRPEPTDEERESIMQLDLPGSLWLPPTLCPRCAGYKPSNAVCCVNCDNSQRAEGGEIEVVTQLMKEPEEDDVEEVFKKEYGSDSFRILLQSIEHFAAVAGETDIDVTVVVSRKVFLKTADKLGISSPGVAINFPVIHGSVTLEYPESASDRAAVFAAVFEGP